GDFGVCALSANDGSTITLPATCSSCSFVMPPGRKITGIASVQSITVDSTPTPAGPASSNPAILPCKSLQTWSAVVGLGFPDVLALGAAIGLSHVLSSALAAGWSGMRTPMVASPAVVLGAHVPLWGRTNVIGPGVNVSINVST